MIYRRKPLNAYIKCTILQLPQQERNIEIPREAATSSRGSWKLLVATKTLVGGISDQDEDFLGDLIRRGSMLTLNVRFKNFIHTTAKNIKPAFSTSVANIFDGVFFFLQSVSHRGDFNTFPVT